MRTRYGGQCGFKKRVKRPGYRLARKVHPRFGWVYYEKKECFVSVRKLRQRAGYGHIQ